MIIGAGSPFRTTVRMMSDPGFPRMSFTASFSVMPLTFVSSSLTIKSPDLSPAFQAGVSSIGATTFTNPSSILTSIPRPPNSPWVPTCISLKASSFK